MAEIHGFIVVNEITPARVQVVNIDQIVRYVPVGTTTEIFTTDATSMVVSQNARAVEGAIRKARSLPDVGA